MAGRLENFLSAEERAELIQVIGGKELPIDDSKAESNGVASLVSKPGRPKGGCETRKTKKKPAIVNTSILSDTGCLVCGLDNEHANLLLCEACNGEYHTFCLNPPLQSVPRGDWFCDSCKPHDSDDLETLVAALPPAFSSRFGEICWAQGGVGYGFWPSIIYDPRLTVNAARNEARKNLGKKHLVYFFQCSEAPFAILPTNKISTWEEGLAEDLHLGAAAKNYSKQRFVLFRQALEAALLELDKPIGLRLDWTNNGGPSRLPTPQKVAPQGAIPDRNNKKRNARFDEENGAVPSPFHSIARKRARRSFEANTPSRSPILDGTRALIKGFEGEKLDLGEGPCHLDLNGTRRSSFDVNGSAKGALNLPSPGASRIEPPDSGELMCRILKKAGSPDNEDAEVGFVVVPSKHTCTLADIRAAILRDLVPDCIPPEADWNFFVPNLGPVGKKLEARLGPILAFLQKAIPESHADGNAFRHLLKVHIVDAPRKKAFAA